MGSLLRKFLLFLPLALMLAPQLSRADIDATFQAHVTLDLCPEYVLGGYDFEVYYRIDGIDSPFTPTELSRSVDSGTNTATVDIELPGTLAKTKIFVTAKCKKTSDSTFSAVSNQLTVTNCDRLALYDTDGDGIPNDQEDRNCDNFYSPGDTSNPDNLDTDGDGVRDLVEALNNSDPSNPGSSPRPFVFAGAPFDTDGDNNSNPVAWRPSNGNWYVKDHQTGGQNLMFTWGRRGDIPFAYDPAGGASDAGVVRLVGNNYQWLFRGLGFMRSSGPRDTTLNFGQFGDNIELGPWENPGVTNPAVARLFNNQWNFYIFKSDGTIAQKTLGGNGDVPKVADYDGDELFDVAVFRPSTQELFVRQSSDNQLVTYNFGSGTADYTVRGDFTGDGIDDIAFWEPTTAVFTAMTSDNGFNDVAAQSADPNYYFEEQLGLYNVHLPMSWNVQSGKAIYTVVDHAQGLRYFRANNNANGSIQSVQWGLPGDSLL